MSVALILGIGALGGVGAALRWVVDGLVRRLAARLPIGTAVINVSGSLLLGVVLGLDGAGLVSSGAADLLAAGLLGGFTTFSSASVETVFLLAERRRLAAAGYAIGVLLAATAALLAGTGLTRFLLG